MGAAMHRAVQQDPILEVRFMGELQALRLASAESLSWPSDFAKFEEQ